MSPSLTSATTVARKTKSGVTGIALILVSTLIYQILQSRMGYLSMDNVGLFEGAAYSYFLVFGLGIIFLFGGVLRLLREGISKVRKLESIPISWEWLIPHILGQRKYLKIFVVSALGYGLFYSFVTSIIVYQPTLSFSQAYLAEIPSIGVVPCCGPAGQIPILVIYLTEHIGLLLIPLTIFFLIVVSLLVGLNFSMASYAYESRHRGRGGWFGGFGAIFGVFTGCPTCAGLLFASIIGGAGATATAVLLASYQSLFIGLSIPILAFGPLLITRNISKMYKEGCILRDPNRAAPERSA